MPISPPKIPKLSREYAAVVALLLVAFLVRLAFFWNQGYAGVDTQDFMSWFQTAATHGLRVFYDVTWSDYPPFNVYFFWIFGLLAQRLSLFGSILFTYVMKLPANIFDMGTALLIFFFVRPRLSFKKSILAMGLYAFNPAVIFDAAVWGQFDAIYAFFLLLSLMLVFKSKPKLAVVAFMLGVLTKPQSIAFAPLFLFLIWRKTDWKGFLASIAVALGTVFAVILPFQWTNNNPVSFLTKIYIGAYSTYNYNSINAFNFWAFGGMWVKETLATFVIGWAAFATVAAFALYVAHKRLDSDKELVAVFAAFVLFFAFFMLPTRIHERYLFPAFSMLALLFPFVKKIRSLYAVLTATCLVNQAYVLYWLNKAFPYAADLSGDLVVFAISLINSLAFLYVLILMFRELRANGRAKTIQKVESSKVHEKNESQSQEVSNFARVAQNAFVSEATIKPVARKPALWGLNKRDIISIIVLCVIFLSIATYNLGSANVPTTTATIAPGQGFYIDLGHSTNVKSLCFLLEDGGYNVSIYMGSPENWTFLSSPPAYSDYYKWNQIGVGQITQYLRVDFGQSSSGNAIIAEVAATDASGQQVTVANVTSLGSGSFNVHNLIDEQDKVQLPATYMQQTYFDEIYFVRTAEQYLHLQSPYEWTHPPLGKLIQAGGIVVFGFSPFGWRFVGVIFGTLMIAVMYLFGKRLFGTWIGAFSSAFLLTFDFMHFTMARMGTADTYVVFFSLVSQLFFFIYFMNVIKKGWRTSVVPLFFAVIFFMLGFSTKWITLFGALGLLALLAALRIRDLRKLKTGFWDKYAHFFDYPFFLLLGFIALGIGIYFLIYIPDMLTGRPFITFPLTGPNDPGIAVVNLQFKMYEYHAGLTATHTFESPWWSWPLMFNPMRNVATSGLPAYVPLWLDVTYSLPGNLISTITVMGNPIVWWVGFFLMLILTERAIRGAELVDGLKRRLSRKRKAQPEPQAIVTAVGTLLETSYSQLPSLDLESAQGTSAIETAPKSTLPPEPGSAPIENLAPPAKARGRRWDVAAIFIVVVFFTSWIPYNAISRVTFIYHFYICVPFLCFASAYFINKYWNTRLGRIATLVFFVAVVALFVAFYPVISGMPISTSYIHYLKWFPSWYFSP